VDSDGIFSLKLLKLKATNFGKSRTKDRGFYGNMNLGWQDRYLLNASDGNDLCNPKIAGRPIDLSFITSIGTSFILTKYNSKSGKMVMSFC